MSKKVQVSARKLLWAHAWALDFPQGILMGTPNREPQEYSRNIIGIYLPVSLYSIIFLLYSYSWALNPKL